MATFYGVWVGRNPGVYDSWDKCKQQTDKFPQAKFSKLNANNLQAALLEFNSLNNNNNTNTESKAISTKEPNQVNCKPTEEVLTVDGASNGMNCEFQAVWYPSGKKAFSSKVFLGGTNNIAEFLGLVLAIKHLKDKNLPLVVYTDSVTAMSWVRDKKANTTARTTGKLTEELENLLTKAELYLKNNQEIMKQVKVLKWETKQWGEIPADFGRK